MQPGSRFLAAALAAGSTLALTVRPASAQSLLTQYPTLTGPATALAASGSTVYVAGGFVRYEGGATPSNAVVSAADGAPEGGFTTNGLVNAVVRDDAGGFVLAGGFTLVNGQPRARLARLNPDLTLDAWNPAADGTVQDMVAAEGRIWIAGAFQHVGGLGRTRLAAFDAATLQLTAWAPYANAEVLTIGVRDSRVYVGGSFGTLGDEIRNRIGALTYEGAVAEWNPNANNTVTDLAVGHDAVWLTGTFTTVGGLPNREVARVDRASGGTAPWGNILAGVLGSSYLGTVAAHGNTLYVAGRFSTAHGEPRPGLAALDAVTGDLLPWNYTPDVPQVRLRSAGDVLYMCGGFRDLGGFVRYRVAAFDGTTGVILPWTCNASGVVSYVSATDDRVWMSGSFGQIAGSVHRNLMAVSAVTGEVLPWSPNPDGAVLDMRADGDRLILAGSFRSFADQPRRGLAVVQLPDRELVPFPAAANDTVRAVAVDEGTLYVGGDFTSFGGLQRNRLAAVDLGTGAMLPWNPGADGSVRSLDAGGGTVYAGGRFRWTGGAWRDYLAAIDGGTGHATAWNPHPSFWVDVVRRGGDAVWAGGLFASIGGTSRYFAAQLDPGTGAATPWDPVLGQGTMTCLDFGGATYVGGNFLSVQGLPYRGLAAFAGDGSLVESWQVTALGSVNAVLAMEHLVFAAGTGSFTAGGTSRNYFAVFDRTPVDAPAVAGRPGAFALGPVTPNPLHDRGTVRLELPREAAVRAALFDVLGRRVGEVLGGEVRGAGAHELPVRRDGLGSGVYFLRVEAAGRTASTKVVVTTR